MGSQQTIKPSGTVTVPANYPNYPTPGKLEILINANSAPLYHKFSPYSDYHHGLLAWGNEPYIYTYIDKANKFPNTTYDSRSFPVGSSLIDVLRVGKFLTSGRGVGFLAKQFILQTGQSFNETRIYNPLSSIVAAGRGATLNLIGRPQRNFDTSAGLLGLLNSLVGVNLTSNVNAPNGTTGPDSLPSINVKSDGKGLSRAQSANAGLNNFKSKWGDPSGGLGFIAAAFSNFIPATQKNIIYKSSEGAYGLMVKDKKGKLSSTDVDGVVNPIYQQWIGGSNEIRKNGEYTTQAGRYFISDNGSANFIFNKDLTGLTITGLGAVGYSVAESTNTLKSGFRYGDAIGADVNDDFESSDVMIQYKDYIDTATTYPSKQVDLKSTTALNTVLQSVITNLKSVSPSENDPTIGLYSVNIPNDTRILSNGQGGTLAGSGYNRLFQTKNQHVGNGSNNMNGKDYPLGLLASYRASATRLVSDDLTDNGKSLRLPSKKFDSLNTLTVITNSDKSSPNSLGWKTLNWSPYDHDQIAFYFYDVVNQNYIPFRAIVTGISEGSSANWDELSFIGRADKVFSYSGFTRTLSFKLNIVIMSLAELLPTWQRINYITTIIKPSNYTSDTVAATGASLETVNNVANRFMIPPMMMLTLGDMYKQQPVIIKNITTTIPEDASWETLNEDNSPEGWNYLADYMTANGMLYGQLPRQVELSFDMNLLEKEEPIVGGANFGHAPRSNIFIPNNWNSNTPNGAVPNKANQSLVVDNNSK